MPIFGNGELLTLIFASTSKQDPFEDRHPFFTENRKPKTVLLGKHCIPKQEINKGLLVRGEFLVPAHDQGQVVRLEVVT